jgi:hypothetical protein
MTRALFEELGASPGPNVEIEMDSEALARRALTEKD